MLENDFFVALEYLDRNATLLCFNRASVEPGGKSSVFQNAFLGHLRPCPRLRPRCGRALPSGLDSIWSYCRFSTLNMHFANGKSAYILKLTCQFLEQTNFFKIIPMSIRLPISVRWPTYFYNIIKFFLCLEKAWEGTSSRAWETALVLQASILSKVSCWFSDIIIHCIASYRKTL